MPYGVSCRREKRAPNFTLNILLFNYISNFLLGILIYDFEYSRSIFMLDINLSRRNVPEVPISPVNIMKEAIFQISSFSPSCIKRHIHLRSSPQLLKACRIKAASFYGNKLFCHFLFKVDESYSFYSV